MYASVELTFFLSNGRFDWTPGLNSVEGLKER